MSTSTKKDRKADKKKKDERPPVSEKVHPMQLSLLKFFSSRSFSEEELKDIKRMISNYYAQKADDAMDKLFEEQGWDVDEKIEEWGKGHYRSKKKGAKSA